jgi:hypothetical protein
VLGPPCIRHRPFAIAAPLHEPPRRVRAPHRGVVFANSRRLNRMRVRAWSAILATPSGLPGGPHPPAIDLPCNNSLATLRNMDVLHCHHFATAGSHALQREQARLIRRRQAGNGASKAADFLVPLPFLGFSTARKRQRQLYFLHTDCQFHDGAIFGEPTFSPGCF